MPFTKALKDTRAAKAKRLVGEVLGEQKLDREGKAQEERARNEREQSGDTRPFGNLDRLT
jgi:hypothetical protein